MSIHALTSHVLIRTRSNPAISHVCWWALQVIFSLMGMQLFGGRYDESIGYSRATCVAGVCTDNSLEPFPRFHFDYFGDAMVASCPALTLSQSQQPSSR